MTDFGIGEAAMIERILCIGDKRFSSWSLRPWLALRHGGISFREELIRLRRPDSQEKIRAVSPSGYVPVLIEGDLRIWDSLAICEWAAERVPSLWPSDPSERAVARSVTAEMHSSFAAMRRELSMDLHHRAKSTELSPEARADVERVHQIWRQCRARHAKQGEFLFGAFSIADCFYAPAVTRFDCYGIELDDVCARYAAAVLSHPGMLAWAQAAAREE